MQRRAAVAVGFVDLSALHCLEKKADDLNGIGGRAVEVLAFFYEGIV